MECIVRQGALHHRTQLLTLSRAESFARCLLANPLFAAVAVQESKTAKGERRHFVQYQPASDSRYRELVQVQADTREQRAQQEAAGYLFVQSECRRWFYCWNLVSGDVYETTQQACDCPDFHYRGAALGPCKHMRMLRSGYANVESWAQASAPTPAPAAVAIPCDADRRAQAQRDRALWD